jgi:hypothetical protein
VQPERVESARSQKEEENLKPGYDRDVVHCLVMYLMSMAHSHPKKNLLLVVVGIASFGNGDRERSVHHN